MKLSTTSCRFLMGTDTIQRLPVGDEAEVAFWGRSNVGKSSLLNKIMKRRQLAKVSKTPGRTQTLNFYSVEDGLRFVDLPGYGYAKVPGSLQQVWAELVPGYLTMRPQLRFVFLLIDARHPLKENDRQAWAFLMSYFSSCGLVLTKTDKVSPTCVSQRLEELKTSTGSVVHCVSSVTGKGIDGLRRHALSFNLRVKEKK